MSTEIRGRREEGMKRIAFLLIVISLLLYSGMAYAGYHHNENYDGWGIVAPTIINPCWENCEVTPTSISTPSATLNLTPTIIEATPEATITPRESNTPVERVSPEAQPTGNTGMPSSMGVTIIPCSQPNTCGDK